ncbi:MAG TPA: phosphate ABC transporter substrate-binding protein PstS [Acidimicrobiia bacterium]|jgi:phosphate transport system substrate-binding protein|nr:phosphate ABC transporter substrate-binding protein PstS [Acidimicrobiia bacterium]
MKRITGYLRWLVPTALIVGLVPLGGAIASAVDAPAQGGSATLNGSGSTFQQPYNEAVMGAFKQKNPNVTINYSGGGSGKGRQDFSDQVVDFAGTDAPYSAADAANVKGGKYFYFPTVAGPITVSYNVSGVSKLRLSAETLAKIFQGDIKTWDDAAIKADNPGVKLPSTAITVVHRSDSSGTTQNFTGFLAAAAPTAWTLGTGSTVSWPADQQSGQGNPGVGQIVKTTDGAVGYVDFSDAKALKLKFASVKNKAGKFVAPTVKATTAAVEKAPVNADLTYNPLNAAGAAAYPIASPTWILAYQNYSDAAKTTAIKNFLNYIYGNGQKIASQVDYAPLPKNLLDKAKAQVKQVGGSSSGSTSSSPAST